MRVISKNTVRSVIVGDHVTQYNWWHVNGGKKIMTPEAASSSRQTARSNDPNGSLLGRLD